MLLYGEVNPLNVFDLRQLDHCPIHFKKIKFDLYVNQKDIVDWIYENLSGRFYIGDVIDYVCESSLPLNVKLQKFVAFELHEEASYFGLFLPTINKNQFSF
jgi:hypothetical protein